jgi:hypothetical protein
MSRRRAINAVLSVAGVALLVWQVQEVGGAAAVTSGLRSVGAGFLPILAMALARFALRSYAWLVLLGQPAPFSAALAATISGDAIGNLTPLGLAASEPAKAVYLGRHVEPGRALAALTAENFFYSVSIAVYVIVGAAAMLAFRDLPNAVHVAGIGALVAMAVALVASGWIAWSQPAAASAVLSRLPSRRLAAMVERVRDFEMQTYGSVGREGARLAAVALAETGFHVISFAESWLTLYLLTGTSLPTHALILDSVNRVINVVFKLVPLRVGVDEVGSETVAMAIGIPGQGLLSALVRKVRMLVFAVAGLAMWGTRRTK